MEGADTASLARERRLVTRELHPFNAFYGHAAVLRRYAGIPGSGPVKAAIAHGVAFAPNPEDPDLATFLPRYFCGTPAQAQFFEEHALHGTRAAAIGPMISYAQALAPPPAPPRGRTLVYFDAHSTHYATAEYDVVAAAAHLTEVGRDFDEVVVCLYWRDVVLGRAALYARHGFRTVTAGHMFDPDFLLRLVAILSSASVVLTDNVGTHLVYALTLDRPVWLEARPVAYELARGAPPNTRGPEAGELFDRAAALFGRRVERIEPDQRAYADEVSGIAELKTPAELAELLAEAEAAYRSETPALRRRRLEATAAARCLWNAARW